MLNLLELISLDGEITWNFTGLIFQKQEDFSIKKK